MTDVVMISVDDLINIDRVRTAFGVELQTPNFDRLKAEGVTFSNAYASVALCNPSRTSILTGTNPFQTGVHGNTETWYERVDPASTLPALMKEAGYATYGFGKVFHTTSMPQNVVNTMFDEYRASRGTPQDIGEDSEFPFGVWKGDPDTTKDAFTIEAAARALQTYSGSDPLLMMVGLSDPHAPHVTPQKYLDLYPLNRIDVPEWDGDAPPDYVRAFLRDEDWQRFREAGVVEEFVQSYLASISEMDYRLGQLLDAVERSGRDPAVVLYSDHGYSLGDHDTVYKFNLWEQATSAPLIISMPGMESAGSVHSGVVSLLDIAPTILDLAGLAVPNRMEGRSLLDAALDPGSPTGGVAVTTMFGSFSIRTDEYRYTRYEDGSIELFDIAADPENKDNLHGKSAYAEVEADLAEALDAKLAEMGVTYDAATEVTMFEQAGGDTQYFLADAGVLATMKDAGGHDVVYAGSTDIVLPRWGEDVVGTTKIDLAITGNAKDNFIAGNFGADTLAGGGGGDHLDGFGEDDELLGGNGDDTLIGNEGDDALLGGKGADGLNGSTGDDRLQGGGGNDVLNGGTGADTFLFTAGKAETDRVTDYKDGLDRIRLLGVQRSDVALDEGGGDTTIAYGDQTIVLEGVTGLKLDDITFG